MSFQTSALILSWVAIALLALVVSGLVRQVQQLSSTTVRRAEPLGLAPGAPAPGFGALASASGATVVLLFLQPGCGTCAELLGEAGRLHEPAAWEFRALYRGAVPDEVSGLPIRAFGDQADLFERYDAIAIPFAVAVDNRGRVLHSEPVGSGAALRRLLDRVAGIPTAQAGDRKGRP